MRRVKLIILLSVSFILPLCGDSFVELPEESNLSLLNPDFKDRKSAKIRLPNGLEAYLISDPKADQSAAALAVGAGSWNDPEEYPGMAHFCEHMLFGGSEKHPGENEFDRLLSDYKGTSNAYTTSEKTVYFFSSNHKGFPTILEQFSRFFIDPLFNPSRIARELHAVDQEFAKNFESEGWRQHMVFLELGNSSHPNSRFSTGNAETLGKIPRETLQNWFRSHYVAEKMRLVLYASSPLEELKKRACELFSEIPTQESASIEWIPLSSERQKGHLTAVVPLKEVQMLSLSWEVPRELCDHSKSAQLLAFILSQGQEYSLYELLKREGLVESVEISTNQCGGPDHLFFDLEMSLTDAGISQLDTVVLRCYQALAGIRESGISSDFFSEKNALAKLWYEYQERGNALSEVSSLGGILLNEPLSTFPRETLLAERYDLFQLKQLLSVLTPEEAILTLQASPEKTGIAPDRRERWMGVEYAVRPISEASMELWKAAAPHPEILLPEKNLFLPKNFDLVAREGVLPEKIVDEEAGVAYYYPCQEFPIPEVALSLHIRTPVLSAMPETVCLMNLYCSALNEQFYSVMSASSAAKLEFSLSAEPKKIHVAIKGFSDKAPLLFKKSMKQLASPKTPTVEQFDRYKESFARSLQNQLTPLAVSRAREVLKSVIDPDKPSPEELLEALSGITYEQFSSFLGSLFDEAYLEGFFSGNVTKEDAKKYWQEASRSLCQSPYLKEKHQKKRQLSIPENEGPFVVREKREQAFGNGAVLVLYQGPFTHKRRAAQQLLADALRPAFFDELRTKQKTGYMVGSYCEEVDLHLFQHFLVQSNSHHPEELLYRFELFLEMELQNLTATIPLERFETLKQSLLDVFKAGFRNLYEQSEQFDLFAYERDADFDWLAKRIEGLESLNYEEFLTEAQGFLSRTNRKRLAVLVEGRSENPFAYESVTPDALHARGVGSF